MALCYNGRFLAFQKTALTDCPGLPVMIGGYGRFYYSGRFRRFRRYGRFLVTPQAE